LGIEDKPYFGQKRRISMPVRRNAQPFVLCALLLMFVGAEAQTVQPVEPMAKEAHPSFEVATIKPHDPASDTEGFDAAGGRIIIRNESLVQILIFAFSIHRSQIVGLPAWARERWDVDGITDTPGQPNVRQQQEMLRKLLGERFGLKFHRDQRELPVYLIQLAKGGPKLKPAAKPDDQTGQYANGHGNEATMTYISTDMSDFIIGESFFLDRPLIDQTRPTGKYDFSLRYNFRESTASDDPNAAPGLFTAVQEQLGLKLIPTKASVEVLILDHVDRPAVD
jgi:uncharacterized protein (TIGR03435 family)